MIRINLLPIRELQRRANTRRAFLAVVGGFVCVLVILGGVAWWQTGRVQDLKGEIGRLEREKRKDSYVLGKISRLKKTKAVLDKKVAVIKRLKQRTTLPVHILDQIADLIPENRMWLNTLRQSGDSLSLQGVALDNATIAQFMEALAGSEYFRAPELISASLQNIAGQNLKAFNMTVKIAPPKKDAS